MTDSDKTVFISYRRNVSAFIARAVFMDLRQNGFDVFMDVEGIDSGEFDRVLLNQIAARAHFVLILTPGSVERCVNPDDWLRREIEHAINLQRNIVPLLVNGFVFPGTEQYLAGTLSTLTKYNALNVPHDYFEAAMEKLRGRFLKQPVYGTIQSTPAVDQTAVKHKLSQAIQQTTLTDEQKMAEEYFKLAVKKQNDDDLDGAIADYTEAIRLNPQHDKAYNNRGGVRKAKGELAEALADYTEAIRLNPNYASAYLNRGRLFLYQQEWDSAINDFNEALRINPNASLAYNERGYAHSRKGDFTNAINDYSQAVQQDKNDTDTYFKRGNLFYDMGEYTKAANDYTEAIRTNPKYHRAYNNRAESYFALGQYDLALADFQKRNELVSGNPITLAGIAITLMMVGRVEEAKTQWQGLIAQDQKYADVKATGKEFVWAKPLIEAAEKLVALIQESPSTFTGDLSADHAKGELDSEAYFLRAVDRSDNSDEEIADYTEAIRLNPQFVDAYNNRGEVYFARGNYPAALADFEKADAIEPHDHFVVAGLAITHHALGDTEKAKRLWLYLVNEDMNFLEVDWVKKELNWHDTLGEEAAKLINKIVGLDTGKPH
jgi:tetratricopeptide (TPR) repeat protein